MMSGTVETDRANGSSQRRYQGYTTGAHKSDAAIGHANACGECPSSLACLFRSTAAVTNPTDDGQTSHDLRTHDSLQCSEGRIIEAKPLYEHSDGSRRDRNTSQKWHIQQPNDDHRQQPVAHSHSAPVKRRQHNREKLHSHSHSECHRRESSPMAFERSRREQ